MARTESEQLVFSVEARIGAMEKQMARAARTTDRTFNFMEHRSRQAARTMEKEMASGAARVGSLMKTFGRGLLAGIAAGGVAGVVSQFGQVAGQVADIGRAANQAGLDARSFQELKYVAEQNRIGVDSLTDGIKELNLRADEFISTGGGSAAEAFQRLGYSAVDLKAKLKDPSALFTEIIGKLQQLDRAAQIRVADEIFGGAGGEKFVQLIAQGEAGIRATINEAHRLGNVMSDDVIARAEELDRKFNQVSTTVGTALKTAIVEAAGALQSFIDSFRGFEDQATSSLQDRWSQLTTRRSQLQGQQGSLQDRFLSYFGKNAEAEMQAIDGEMASIAAELKKRALPKLRQELLAQWPGTSSTAPTKPDDKSSSRAASKATVDGEAEAVRRLIAELQTELQMIGATDLERDISNTLRQAGAAATEEQRAKIVALVSALHAEAEAQRKASDAAEEHREIAEAVLSGLRSALADGKLQWSEMADIAISALDKIIDKIQSELLDALDGIGGGSGGFGGLLRFLFMGFEGFAGGGYTGPGAKYQPAGVVHRGEYVFSKQATDKIGVANLDAMHKGTMKGYATGGLVSAPAAVLAPVVPSVAARAPATASPVVVNFSPTIDARGADVAAVARLEQSLARQQAELESKVRAIVSRRPNDRW